MKSRNPSLLARLRVRLDSSLARLRVHLDIAFALSLLACHPPASGGAFGHTLERGGALAEVHIDEMNVQITEHSVSTWGLLEVPDGSRMQAAYAGVDAIARAELLKLIRVRVAGEMVSIDSTDPARRDAYERTVEVVAGSLRRAGTTEHGWERVQQGSTVILRIWSRLTVPRADVEAALQAAQSEGELVLPSGVGAPARAGE
jgi:hypothetical protein